MKLWQLNALVLLIAIGVALVVHQFNKSCQERRCERGVPRLMQYQGCVCVEVPR